ncbi:MAG: CPBP family intramembrane glutamic endopeptidase [Planctomycetota bacterium]
MSSHDDFGGNSDDGRNQNPYAIVERPGHGLPKTGEDFRQLESKRVWPCFVALAAAISAAIGSQIVIVLALFAVRTSNGESVGEISESLTRDLSQPYWFVFLGLLSQIPMFVAAMVAARMSPSEAFRERLKLNPTGWSIGRYVVVTLSAIFPTAIGMLLAGLLTLLLPPDPSVALLYENMTIAWAIPFLLFISLAPGFGEELLFRGYVQGRFLKRWSPMVSITASSIIFGLFHIMPHTVVFATVVGFWLGYVAWKSNSIWPTIICHAFINGAWNILNLSQQFTGMSDQIYYGLCIGISLIGLVSFIITLRIFASEPGARAIPV